MCVWCVCVCLPAFFFLHGHVCVQCETEHAQQHTVQDKDGTVRSVQPIGDEPSDPLKSAGRR